MKNALRPVCAPLPRAILRAVAGRKIPLSRASENAGPGLLLTL